MLEERLQNLKRELIGYATLVEQMIEKCKEALLKRQQSLIREVMEKDEPEANCFEIKIDELCINLVAQFEPKAKDLRTILTILKMGNDLERMADHAVNIGESAAFLIDHPSLKPLIDIPRMADIAIKMLQDGIDSFINENVQLAKQVCERDILVDNLNDQIIRELITYMTSRPVTIEQSLHLMRISRNLERIADLSTNICEDVIYMAEGSVIKHHRGDGKP